CWWSVQATMRAPKGTVPAQPLTPFFAALGSCLLRCAKKVGPASPSRDSIKKETLVGRSKRHGQQPLERRPPRSPPQGGSKQPGAAVGWAVARGVRGPAR